jgi:hypothetical protein
MPFAGLIMLIVGGWVGRQELVEFESADIRARRMAAERRVDPWPEKSFVACVNAGCLPEGRGSALTAVAGERPVSTSAPSPNRSHAGDDVAGDHKQIVPSRN